MSASDAQLGEDAVQNRAAGVGSLVASLASPDGMEREKARRHLVDIGRAAVPDLIEALRSTNKHARWEAAHALAEIRDSRAAPAFVQALKDEESAIRWLAAKGLIALGREALIPVLQALEKDSDLVYMRDGARHVLHSLIRDGLADEAVPVLEALENLEPVVESPVAAYKTLQILRKTTKEAQ